MGIGASLFLIALGAILTFGLTVDTIGWLNLDVVGWVLMLVGVVGMGLTFYFWQRRRRTVVRAYPREYPEIHDTAVVHESPTLHDPVVEEEHERHIRRS